MLPTFDETAKNNIAYYFDAAYPEREWCKDERSALHKALESWRTNFVYSHLACLEISGSHFLVDTRVPREPVMYRLAEPEFLFLRAFRNITGIETCERAASAMLGVDAAAFVERCVAHGLFVAMGNRVVSLVETEAELGAVMAAVIAVTSDDFSASTEHSTSLRIRTVPFTATM